MKYRLYLNNVLKGKNKIIIPEEIGKVFKDDIGVYIDNRPIWNEITLSTDYTLTFESYKDNLEYIDVSFGGYIPENLDYDNYSVGSIWDESSNPSMTRDFVGDYYQLNETCYVVDWKLVNDIEIEENYFQILKQSIEYNFIEKVLYRPQDIDDRHKLTLKGGTSGINRLTLPAALADYYGSDAVVYHRGRQVRSEYDTTDDSIDFQALLSSFDEIEIGRGRELALEDYTDANDTTVEHWQPSTSMDFWFTQEEIVNQFPKILVNYNGTICQVSNILGDLDGYIQSL